MEAEKIDTITKNHKQNPYATYDPNGQYAG